MTSDADARFCASCGASIPGGARFCPDCGAAVHAAPPVRAPAGPVQDSQPGTADRIAARRPGRGKSRRTVVAVVVLVALVLGGLVAVSALRGGGNDNDYPLGMQPPALGERPDLFALAGRSFTTDGCRFQDDRAEDTGTDVMFKFECPDETQFISGEAVLAIHSSESDVAYVHSNRCGRPDHRFFCSSHDGLVGIEAYASTLSQARERLRVLARTVAALPAMTSDPGPAPQSSVGAAAEGSGTP